MIKLELVLLLRPEGSYMVILKLKVFGFVILATTLFISGCMQQSNGNKITADKPLQREDTVLINSSEKESKNWKVTLSVVEQNELGLGYSYEVIYKGDETIEDISVHFLDRGGSISKLSHGKGLGGTVYSIKDNPTEVRINIKWGKSMNELFVFEQLHHEVVSLHTNGEC